MSGWALVTIACDEPHCGQWTEAGIAHTAAEARKRLAGAGWKLNVQDPRATRRGYAYPRLDYCPKHANLSDKGTP